MKIEVPATNTKATSFCVWLNDHGYDAFVGNTPEEYVDGEWAVTSISAGRVFNILWIIYCNQNHFNTNKEG